MGPAIGHYLQELGLPTRIVNSSGPGDVQAKLRAALADRPPVVIAAGGDGTVHEAVNGWMQAGGGAPLGVVPVGTGNDFAKMLEASPDWREACWRIVRRDTRRVDVGRCNDFYFANGLGIGFDAWIAGAFANAGARGFATYVRVGLRGFLRYQSEEYQIDVDGDRGTRRALVVAVANASQYGNNARIAPLASLQDGLLDVTVVSRAHPIAAARLFTGTLHRAWGVTTMRGRVVEIRRRNAGPAHLDGEPLTLPETLRVEIVPRSLRVVVPDAQSRL